MIVPDVVDELTSTAPKEYELVVMMLAGESLAGPSPVQAWGGVLATALVQLTTVLLT